MPPLAEVVVRPAELADAESSTDLRERVAAEGRWVGSESPIDRARSLDGFIRYVSADDMACFVAVTDDTVVGSVFIQFTVPGVTAFGMQVDADLRHQGIGTALIAEVITWSRTHDAHKIELEVWPHNTPAISLYEKSGFEREGRRRRQYRRRNGELWDVVVMGLVLDTTSPGSSISIT